MGERFDELVKYAKKQSDEEPKKRLADIHQTFVQQLVVSAEGGAKKLHKITKLTHWRGGLQRLEEDGKLDNKLKERWQNKKLRDEEEAIPMTLQKERARVSWNDRNLEQTSS